MKKWKITLETENGKVITRYIFAPSLDEASNKMRNKIPVTWRIVSVTEYFLGYMPK